MVLQIYQKPTKNALVFSSTPWAKIDELFINNNTNIEHKYAKRLGVKKQIINSLIIKKKNSKIPYNFSSHRETPN